MHLEGRLALGDLARTRGVIMMDQPCYYSSSGKAAVLANERAVPTCWVWLKSLEGRLNVGSHALADEACYDKELHSHVFLPPVADASRLT